MGSEGTYQSIAAFLSEHVSAPVLNELLWNSLEVGQIVADILSQQSAPFSTSLFVAYPESRFSFPSCLNIACRTKLGVDNVLCVLKSSLRIDDELDFFSSLLVNALVVLYENVEAYHSLMREICQEYLDRLPTESRCTVAALLGMNILLSRTIQIERSINPAELSFLKNLAASTPGVLSTTIEATLFLVSVFCKSKLAQSESKFQSFLMAAGISDVPVSAESHSHCTDVLKFLQRNGAPCYQLRDCLIQASRNMDPTFLVSLMLELGDSASFTIRRLRLLLCYFADVLCGQSMPRTPAIPLELCSLDCLIFLSSLMGKVSTTIEWVTHFLESSLDKQHIAELRKSLSLVSPATWRLMMPSVSSFESLPWLLQWLIEHLFSAPHERDLLGLLGSFHPQLIAFVMLRHPSLRSDVVTTLELLLIQIDPAPLQAKDGISNSALVSDAFRHLKKRSVWRPADVSNEPAGSHWEDAAVLAFAEVARLIHRMQARRVQACLAEAEASAKLASGQDGQQTKADSTGEPKAKRRKTGTSTGDVSTTSETVASPEASVSPLLVPETLVLPSWMLEDSALYSVSFPSDVLEVVRVWRRDLRDAVTLGRLVRRFYPTDRKLAVDQVLAMFVLASPERALEVFVPLFSILSAYSRRTSPYYAFVGAFGRQWSSVRSTSSEGIHAQDVVAPVNSSAQNLVLRSLFLYYQLSMPPAVVSFLVDCLLVAEADIREAFLANVTGHRSASASSALMLILADERHRCQTKKLTLAALQWLLMECTDHLSLWSSLITSSLQAVTDVEFQPVMTRCLSEWQRQGCLKVRMDLLTNTVTDSRALVVNVIAPWINFASEDAGQDALSDVVTLLRRPILLEKAGSEILTALLELIKSATGTSQVRLVSATRLLLRTLPRDRLIDTVRFLLSSSQERSSPSLLWDLVFDDALLDEIWADSSLFEIHAGLFFPVFERPAYPNQVEEHLGSLFVKWLGSVVGRCIEDVSRMISLARRLAAAMIVKTESSSVTNAERTVHLLLTATAKSSEMASLVQLILFENGAVVLEALGTLLQKPPPVLACKVLRFLHLLLENGRPELTSTGSYFWARNMRSLLQLLISGPETVSSTAQELLLLIASRGLCPVRSLLESGLALRNTSHERLYYVLSEVFTMADDPTEAAEMVRVAFDTQGLNDRFSASALALLNRAVPHMKHSERLVQRILSFSLAAINRDPAAIDIQILVQLMNLFQKTLSAEEQPRLSELFSDCLAMRSDHIQRLLEQRFGKRSTPQLPTLM